MACGGGRRGHASARAPVMTRLVPAAYFTEQAALMASPGAGITVAEEELCRRSAREMLELVAYLGEVTCLHKIE